VQGAGRINVAKAIENNVFITSASTGEPYGELGVFTGSTTLTLTITIRGSETFTATVDGYVTTSHTQYNTANQGRLEEIGTLDAPKTITVEAGKTATLSVVVAAEPTWDNTFIDGRILLETEDTGLVFPFMGYLGDWSIYSEEDTIDGDAKFPDNNNIIDLPWWNGDYTWTGSTGLYWPQTTGRVCGLGHEE